MLQFSLLLLAVFCVGIHSVDVCPPTQLQNTPFSDEKNCSRFKVCVGNRAHLFNCPSNLHFSPQSTQCEYETDVAPPEGYCEYNDMIFDKPHMCSCRKYVFCNFGVPQIMHCPDGFRFNETIAELSLSEDDASTILSSNSVCSPGNCSE
ncbi:hypothetical protein JTB14_036643 [Gonioctena quinquepunctata]|nr:hypothetical protein JTB14_036643 [Gonioctena quinquepunctata]